uniref:PPIase cyclophilin-type domain-containing protein n=1 Tax=Hyaloperonospora arabidopsidis (strain Emoy2) TaxID=559515 RepID=M4BXN3_HYAAE
MDAANKRRVPPIDAEKNRTNDSLPPPLSRPASRHGARSPASSSSWFGAPLVYVALLFFGFMICVHVWQFSSLEMRQVLSTPFYNKTMVRFSTKCGTFIVDLYPEHAPKTVEAFKTLVDSGYYLNNTGFYYNEPKFVLQGGGYLSRKKSPINDLPVEYSAPSTERMVVIARSVQSNSGSTEFAIMLHDNTERNKPNKDGPGYTAFGRVVEGWHTIEFISKKMPSGYMIREDIGRQIGFDKVEFVERVTNDNEEARLRLEELTYVLETPHSVVIIAERNCPVKSELRKMLHMFRTTVRVKEIGWMSHVPFEWEALEALTGRTTLPLVFIQGKYIGGLREVQKLEQMGTLRAMLEKSGTLAEDTVWTAINQNALVLFSKSYCPYCKKTKETLAELGAKPLVFELDTRDDGPAIQAFLFRLTRQSTVPNLFIRSKSVGGNDNVQELKRSGELLGQLEDAGVIF